MQILTTMSQFSLIKPNWNRQGKKIEYHKETLTGKRFRGLATLFHDLEPLGVSFWDVDKDALNVFLVGDGDWFIVGLGVVLYHALVEGN